MEMKVLGVRACSNHNPGSQRWVENHPRQIFPFPELFQVLGTLTQQLRGQRWHGKRALVSLFGQVFKGQMVLFKEKC